MTSTRTIFTSSYVLPVIAASMFLTVLGQAEAGVTITAKTAALVDVSAAIAVAADGDTVVVPPGTGHWASPLFITKGITLQGATTIDTSTAKGTANDQTIILDDINVTLYPGNQIINVKLTPNQVFRMTGLTFRAGLGNTVYNFGVVLGGTW